MHISADKDRLSKLDLANFKIGESVLHCACGWQSDQHVAMGKECPDCSSKLNISRIDNELIALTGG